MQDAQPASPDSAWYTRSVVVVADMARSLAFYIERLGFKEDWASVEDGRADVAQVSRGGCELILCAHWPERVGRSLLFIELLPEVLTALRTELQTKGLVVENGWWGYDLMVVRDPDGNTLYFPYDGAAPPTDAVAAAAP